MVWKSICRCCLAEKMNSVTTTTTTTQQLHNYCYYYYKYSNATIFSSVQRWICIARKHWKFLGFDNDGHKPCLMRYWCPWVNGKVLKYRWRLPDLWDPTSATRELLVLTTSATTTTESIMRHHCCYCCYLYSTTRRCKCCLCP